MTTKQYHHKKEPGCKDYVVTKNHSDVMAWFQKMHMEAMDQFNREVKQNGQRTARHGKRTGNPTRSATGGGK